MLLLSLVATNESKAGSLDESLIRKTAAGNRQAFARLYELTKSSVYGFALSILRNSHSAEDVMQEVYVKVYYAAHSYIPQGKPMAWILRITRNLSLMKLREKSSAPLDLHFDLQYENDNTDRLVLETVMNQLSEDERQIVALHAVSGLKHREIAALLDLKLSTVLSKYRRAILKLKELLEEDAHE
jgi:RNA polymerase sigma-70 factor (ECF subfamily)